MANSRPGYMSAETIGRSVRLTPSEGYLLDTVYPVGAEPQRYTAEYNPIALDVTEQVIRGGVALTKVDKDYPENKLEGAVFEVYRDSNHNQEWMLRTNCWARWRVGRR